MFYCQDCTQSFPSQNDLDDHMAQAHLCCNEGDQSHQTFADNKNNQQPLNAPTHQENPPSGDNHNGGHDSGTPAPGPTPHPSGLPQPPPTKSCLKPPGQQQPPPTGHITRSRSHTSRRRVTFAATDRCLITGAPVTPHRRDRDEWRVARRERRAARRAEEMRRNWVVDAEENAEEQEEGSSSSGSSWGGEGGEEPVELGSAAEGEEQEAFLGMPVAHGVMAGEEEGQPGLAATGEEDSGLGAAEQAEEARLAERRRRLRRAIAKGRERQRQRDKERPSNSTSIFATGSLRLPAGFATVRNYDGYPA
ncbi:hypothetical protein F5144DRAFT_550987 [Chaetomium tenue]|uniref:Uncharacterized protein n=1 Tax=Chaetomium tenue TaxID=1854479 RepID=A0ACB7P0P6_9PEZI|nr:hypothetical protein F5144DRAFT_550987 [Chaetomium globosum]